MPRMTHAQLIEAARLKLEELEAKATEKQQSEHEKLIEKHTALVALINKKNEAFKTKVDALVATHNEVQAKRLAKLEILDLELAAIAPDNVAVAN